jgi:hypothetical protein
MKAKPNKKAKPNNIPYPPEMCLWVREEIERFMDCRCKECRRAACSKWRACDNPRRHPQQDP